MDERDGPITKHYLTCPFCGSYMNLDTKVCNRCEAKPMRIIWQAALIGESQYVLATNNLSV